MARGRADGMLGSSRDARRSDACSPMSLGCISGRSKSKLHCARCGPASDDLDLTTRTVASSSDTSSVCLVYCVQVARESREAGDGDRISHRLRGIHGICVGDGHWARSAVAGKAFGFRAASASDVTTTTVRVVAAFRSLVPEAAGAKRRIRRGPCCVVCSSAPNPTHNSPGAFIGGLVLVEAFRRSGRTCDSAWVAAWAALVRRAPHRGRTARARPAEA